jgi:hypothetical protein
METTTKTAIDISPIIYVILMVTVFSLAL